MNHTAYNKQLIEQLKGRTILIKYGGNAMLNDELKENVISNIHFLNQNKIKTVVVHGGGPFIKEMLSKVGIVSEFIDGQRKTTPEALTYIEMVLKGQVNSDLVRRINARGSSAVGLSGKDGKMIEAIKRTHKNIVDGKEQIIDLERVGDVNHVSVDLINILTDNQYIPVVASIGSCKDGIDYNINADIFAGHIAGALKAEAYIAMTDVDGLMDNPDRPDSLYRELNVSEIEALKGSVIKGGMIPKIDSCLNALAKGVKNVRIINGTKQNAILKELFTESRSGTLLRP